MSTKNTLSIAITLLLSLPHLLPAQCPSGMTQTQSYCGMVCEGEPDDCLAVLPTYLDFSREDFLEGLDWGLQGPNILLNCDEPPIPAKAKIKELSKTDTVEDYSMYCVEYEHYQTTDVSRETKYYLQAVFDGSIYKVNGSTQSPVNICSVNDIEATLVNNDPETIKKARSSQILITAQKYKKVIPDDCCLWGTPCLTSGCNECSELSLTYTYSANGSCCCGVFEPGNTISLTYQGNCVWDGWGDCKTIHCSAYSFVLRIYFRVTCDAVNENWNVTVYFCNSLGQPENCTTICPSDVENYLDYYIIGQSGNSGSAYQCPIGTYIMQTKYYNCGIVGDLMTVVISSK